VEGVADLRGDVERARLAQRTGLQVLLQRAADEELHGEIELSLVEAAVIEHHDGVQVAHARGEPALAEEARLRLPVVAEARRDDLDRDAAIHLLVEGAIDHAHTAAAQPALDQIAAGDDAPGHGGVPLVGVGWPGDGGGRIALGHLALARCQPREGRHVRAAVATGAEVSLRLLELSSRHGSLEISSEEVVGETVQPSSRLDHFCYRGSMVSGVLRPAFLAAAEPAARAGFAALP